jgi:hypothetical protein
LYLNGCVSLLICLSRQMMHTLSINKNNTINLLPY